MNVFGPWQNDSNPKVNQHLLHDTLGTGVVQAGNGLGFEDSERPELNHDTQNTPGMADITNTILRNISEAAVFVASLMPMGKQQKEGTWA